MLSLLNIFIHMHNRYKTFATRTDHAKSKTRSLRTKEKKKLWNRFNWIAVETGIRLTYFFLPYTQYTEQKGTIPTSTSHVRVKPRSLRIKKEIQELKKSARGQ